MAKMIAYPVMILSAAGVVLCLSFYVLGLTRIYSLPAKGLPILFGGLFAVWLPTVILSNRLTQDFKNKDFLESSSARLSGVDESCIVGCDWLCVRRFLSPSTLTEEPRRCTSNVCTLPDTVLCGFVLCDVLAH